MRSHLTRFRTILQTQPLSLLFGAVLCACLIALLLGRSAPSDQPPHPHPMAGPARSFVLWLHGLGDSGPANEPIRSFFSDSVFNLTKWAFPSAPNQPVSCNYGSIMPSWFDIHEIPISSASPKNEKEVIEAVQKVHAMIDKEVENGISPENVFVCGFSQGGALTLASVLLYPKTLGGGAVFSGWVPFNSSIIEKISPEAKKTPILWSHGMADQTVLFEAGQAGPPFLQQAGMSCEFKAYPGLGHTITGDEINSLKSWIKSRLKSSS
ncbi:Acyl-protein thioesterase 1 [Rhynchospora pubera]|uniref:Acyl-protein thioesterase 1 n=1 Tax=Rhynchospora pubera TaxID=906938 RepID=A0AAV8F3Q2_9POAL|nr:Acyl-protein thioesterase 1 [Rhynchospora pubera]